MGHPAVDQIKTLISITDKFYDFITNHKKIPQSNRIAVHNRILNGMIEISELEGVHSLKEAIKYTNEKVRASGGIGWGIAELEGMSALDLIATLYFNHIHLDFSKEE